MQPSTIYCDTCGTANRPQARFCIGCGQAMPIVSTPAPSAQAGPAVSPPPVSPPSPAGRIGQQLGNYRLHSLLGEGGFAQVYLGEHVYLKTQAAIKLLHMKLAAPDDLDSFLKEAQTVARLVHPHIVRVLEFGLDGQTPFLVMDYATGGTLRQRHHRGTLLPLSTVVSYVKQVTDALQYAHDKKFIHRDIKPENMLIGERDAVLLSDFGIALIAQSTRYQSTQDVVGTVAYMSPEQIQGKPRPASDQYSLGIVVYEWLTGDRPFHGSFIERSGEPEVYDKHMAIYYADVVMSLFESGTHGVMAAYRDGAFISTDIPGKNLPARRVNPADYHTTRYRPRF